MHFLGDNDPQAGPSTKRAKGRPKGSKNKKSKRPDSPLPQPPQPQAPQPGVTQLEKAEALSGKTFKTFNEFVSYVLLHFPNRSSATSIQKHIQELKQKPSGKANRRRRTALLSMVSTSSGLLSPQNTADATLDISCRQTKLGGQYHA